jgi:hypothetical protein
MLSAMLSRRLPPWLIVTMAACLLTIFVALIFVGPPLLNPPLSPESLKGIADPKALIELQQAQSQLQNNTRSVLLQVVGGIVVLIGLTATWRQVMNARDGQITDRLGRAVEQLGSDNVDVRTGGIYALERVGNNSVADRPTVQYMLSTFVRGHAPWAAADAPGEVDQSVPWMYERAPDVQAAMNVLGRRPPNRKALRLYLSRVDLRSANLNGSSLPGAIMRRANLARAELTGARLDGGDLKGTDLRQAVMVRASLVGANLAAANLRGADLRGADLRGADLRGADVRAQNVRTARLIGARADAGTVWPDAFNDDELRDLGIDGTSVARTGGH